MTLLYAGLGLFFAAHLFPVFKGARSSLIAQIGGGPYKLGFTAVSLIGLGLIIHGYGEAPFVPIYEPYSEARSLAHFLMPFAFIFMAGAHMRSNLKSVVSSPMSLGVLLWAFAHLAANGDLASLLLFGAFALLSVIDIFVIAQSKPPPPPQPRHRDFMLVLAGCVGYAAVAWAHGAVFGVYVIGG